MPSRNLTELVLARVVGQAQAQAIVGDLLELSSTRGRLWYYAASLQTIVSFTWRLPATILAGCLAFIIFQRLERSMLQQLWHSWMTHRYITEALRSAVLDLSFVVAATAFLYGVKDRLFKLSFAAFVLVSLIYFCFGIPLVLFALIGLGSMALASSLISGMWRGALLVLALTAAVGILADLNFGNWAHLGCWIYAHKPLNETSHYHYFELGYAFPRTIFWTVVWAKEILDVVVVYFVCFHLRQLLSPSSHSATLVGEK